MKQNFTESLVRWIGPLLLGMQSLSIYWDSHISNSYKNVDFLIIFKIHTHVVTCFILIIYPFCNFHHDFQCNYILKLIS